MLIRHLQGLSCFNFFRKRTAFQCILPDLYLWGWDFVSCLTTSFDRVACMGNRSLLYLLPMIWAFAGKEMPKRRIRNSPNKETLFFNNFSTRLFNDFSTLFFNNGRSLLYNNTTFFAHYQR